MNFVPFGSDIDIDLADRDQILKLLPHVPASMDHSGVISRHNSGVYFTKIPQDPITSNASIEFNVAEERGYIKIDLLNNSVYAQIRNEAHLNEMMTAPPHWEKLLDLEYFSKIVHIGSHYDLMRSMPQPINSVTRMAMFLAIIRPGKRHLAGKPWDEVAKTVWDKPTDGSYYFKKAHAISYSVLVTIHMNLTG